MVILKEILGKEFTFMQEFSGKEPIPVKCFVAAADDEIGITSKAVDEDEFAEVLSKGYDISLEEAKSQLREPYDFVICIPLKPERHRLTHKMYMNSFVKLLKDNQSNIYYKDFTGISPFDVDGAGKLASCPFE